MNLAETGADRLNFLGMGIIALLLGYYNLLGAFFTHHTVEVYLLKTTSYCRVLPASCASITCNLFLFVVLIKAVFEVTICVPEYYIL